MQRADEAVDVRPGQQPPLDLPDFERQLLPLWQQHARLGPGTLEHAAEVMVWFNDHTKSLDTCSCCVRPHDLSLSMVIFSSGAS